MRLNKNKKDPGNEKGRSICTPFNSITVSLLSKEIPLRQACSNTTGPFLSSPSQRDRKDSGTKKG